ncbi:hypothetical protein MMC11_007674 [Xylographa trunciseda]|nr:hypothetical protein [Xylographa trunciseda]
MAQAALLSDLCTVCHSPPKYRCPRCSARTCSLACSKRHKQWAQCSGVRNPAAYLKRHELATPKYFDQDYNFIAGIERTLETAERDVTARGVQLYETRPANKRDGPMKGEVNLRQALEKSGVVVERAPVGMKRNLQNKTSWSKNQRCISWTIEWITNNDTADLGTCLETQTLSQAFAKHIGEPPPAKKRKFSKKRKGSNGTVIAPERDTHQPVQSPGPSAENPSPSSSFDAGSQIYNPATKPILSDCSPQESQHPFADTPQPPLLGSTPSSLSPSFYLHIPNPQNPSSKPTLLPLSPSRPLSDLLRTRLVREFPTIYVLDHPPENLPPENFTLQRDLTGEVAAELTGLLDGGEAESEVLSEGGVAADATGELDGEGGNREGGSKDAGASKPHNRANGTSAPGRAGTGTQAATTQPAGALATGNDELSWILREVM